MSYILEALKKSQQERELGHVPTLETPPFLSEESGQRPSPWVLSAVVLAALAVAIALYSALRGNAPVPELVETVDQKAPSPAPAQAPSAGASLPPTAAAAPRLGEDLFESQDEAAPAPIPKAADTPLPDSSIVMEAPAAPQPKTPMPPSVGPSPAAPAPAPLPTPVSPRDTKVPPDLIADIEAFKREVRKTKSSQGASKEKTQSAVAPRDLRLSKEVRKRLPEFVMSAHIYDKEPAKRFVLINGLKVREGEESREEIAVEEILSDGAVLSFEGNRFFQRR